MSRSSRAALLLLDRFDEIAVGAGVIGARRVAQQAFVFLNLLAEELLLVAPRHADPLEGAMGHEDAVPLRRSRSWRSGAFAAHESGPPCRRRAAWRWDRAA